MAACRACQCSAYQARWEEARDRRQLERHWRDAPAPALDERPRKLKAEDDEHEEHPHRFAGATPGQQPLDPGKDHAAQKQVHRGKQGKDQQCPRQQVRPGQRNPHGNANQPEQRCHHDGVEQAVGQTEQEEYGEAQGETQQVAEIEAGSGGGEQHRQEVPSEEDAPQQQDEQPELALGHDVVGARGECQADAGDSESAQRADQSEREEIELATSCAQ